MSVDGPFFVDPHAPESEGVDYLGLRAINLSMMDTLLPGLNNVVSMIRPFSLMSWVAWRFEQAVVGRAMVSTKDFEVFKQKVETAFVYSQVQAGDADGLPGRQQRVPAGDTIRFQFSTFQRTGSILDAALYGPAIKNLSGLGFLRATEFGFVKVTPPGEKLALALDGLLRSSLSTEQYDFISSVTSIDAPRTLIDERFYQAWSISAVSLDEQAAFSERLFQPNAIGQRHSHARRSAVLLYAREALRELGRPATVVELRRSMASTFPVGLDQHAQRQTLRQVQAHWRLLQVRQAQRLALEALFGWVERCLLTGRASSVDDLVQLAMLALDVEAASAADKSYMGQKMDSLRATVGGLDELFAAGLNNPGTFDIFGLSDTLETAAKGRQPSKDAVAGAVELLLLCARYAQAFRADPVTKEEVGAGAPFRLPLGAWHDFVKNHEQQPISGVLHKVFGSYIVSQHLGVAAARSGDEKSRMRLSIEDTGLTSLLPSAAKALSPKRTPDRLGSALALMADCGLVQEAPRTSAADPLAYSI